MNEKPQFKNHKICHYLNGGEKICTLENMTFTPDGFCSIQGHDHYFQVRKSFCIQEDVFNLILQFHGCYNHIHTCKTSLTSKRIAQDPAFQQRCATIDKLCAKYGTLHKIYGCEWSELEKQVTIEKPFSCFLDKPTVHENEIFDAIINDKLFGMVKVDIDSPQAVIDRYMQLNYPPIIRKVTPDESMISPRILANMKARKIPIAEDQLTQTFHAKGIFFRISTHNL